MRNTLVVLAACCMAPAIAEEASPYAGEQDRPIKSLSEAEIRALQNGEGMGFARLAELNSYPGPRHVLDLAEDLALSEEQTEETRDLYDQMHRSAVATG